MTSIYVETIIEAPMDRVWAATQDHRQHSRWDLRFGRIDPDPAEHSVPAATIEGPAPVDAEHSVPINPAERRVPVAITERPASFTYATTVFPGIEISGHGVHTGERRGIDGSAVSALRFGSDDARSPIRDGSGYWRYVPVPGGVRFLTGYSYRTRWGPAGRLVDLIFGPAFGWATAWSFDRLRLWLEHGVTPERARAHALAEALARCSIVAGAAALDGRWPVVVGAAALALAVPPHALTPAARRCRRRPARKDPR